MACHVIVMAAVCLFNQRMVTFNFLQFLCDFEEKSILLKLLFCLKQLFWMLNIALDKFNPIQFNSRSLEQWKSLITFETTWHEQSDNDCALRTCCLTMNVRTKWNSRLERKKQNKKKERKKNHVAKLYTHRFSKITQRFTDEIWDSHRSSSHAKLLN